LQPDAQARACPFPALQARLIALKFCNHSPFDATHAY
jgi:hypothetical protein